MTATPSALITGASTGIGATYADRFARRGHDLVLVARDRKRMEALAACLKQETGVAIDIIQADLTQAAELAVVEARLRDDARIGILINNAGTADLFAFGRPYIANPDLVERLRIGAPLAEINPATIYGGSAAGYTDYPCFTEASGS